jgi:hypothetical protein
LTTSHQILMLQISMASLDVGRAAPVSLYAVEDHFEAWQGVHTETSLLASLDALLPNMVSGMLS